MDYAIIRQHPTQFLSLTSVLPEEFDLLLPHFETYWERYYRYHTLEGNKRRMVSYHEHGNAKLRGTPTKLFFLLVYLKTNSLQQHQAASFEVSQSKVSRMAHVLLDIFNQTLKSLSMNPVRDGSELAAQLAAHSGKVFTYDGIERPIQRNSDGAAQEQEYSGKKKGHRLKNNLLCDQMRLVLYLSPTEPGSTHEKAIADLYPIELPDGSVLRQDLGFLGHRPQGVSIEQPFKKPKGGELTFTQKLYNQMLASTRVVVEHTNSGVKRLRIIKDTLRIHGSDFRDGVMLAACALHNFRTFFRAWLACAYAMLFLLSA